MTAPAFASEEARAQAHAYTFERNAFLHQAPTPVMLAEKIEGERSYWFRRWRVKQALTRGLYAITMEMVQAMTGAVGVRDTDRFEDLDEHQVRYICTLLRNYERMGPQLQKIAREDPSYRGNRRRANHAIMRAAIQATNMEVL